MPKTAQQKRAGEKCLIGPFACLFLIQSEQQPSDESDHNGSSTRVFPPERFNEPKVTECRIEGSDLFGLVAHCRR